MNHFRIAVSSILLTLVSAYCAHSADDTLAPSDLRWLAAKTHLTTGIVIPSVSFSGQASDDVVHRATFRDIKLTAEGGTCNAVFERGRVRFNDFGDGEFLQLPTIETHRVSLRAIEGSDPRGEGRRIYAVGFQKGKYLNQVYIVFSPGPIWPDRLLVVGRRDMPQPIKVPAPDQGGHGLEGYYSFKHIVPLVSQGQPNLLTAIPRQDVIGGEAINVQIPGQSARSTISIGGQIGTTGSIIDDSNNVGRDAFGDLRISTTIGFLPKDLVLQERKLKDPTNRDRRIVDLIPGSNPRKSSGGIDAGQFSLVLDRKSAGADRLLIYTDGRLSNVEAFSDRQRVTFLLNRAEE